MTLILFTLLLVTAFLFGTLVLALYCQIRFGDESAAYPLFAVRDKLIGMVVFDGVDRADPWLDYLYESANAILTGCHVMGGPAGWPRAAAFGERYGGKSSRKTEGSLPSRPDSPLEPRFAAAVEDLEAAVSHLLKHHIGWRTFMSSAERERRRIQRQRAREVRDEMRAVLSARSRRHELVTA
nr:MAG: hypothetical protein DIU80_21795 [Chloroflexota bacterium]